MNVVAMLRVRNEARWITRCLESIAPLCTGGIIVLDDHSTDGTTELAVKAGATVVHSPFGGLNEARDKNLLLGLAMQSNPDWILAIDGDEELLPQLGVIANLRAAMHTSPCTALSLPIWYLWDREDQIRCDGVYGNFHRESVFRPRAGAYFHEGAAPNFHCGNVPPALREDRQVIHAPLLHYGYMDRDDRMRKYSWYNAKDPANHAEDEYRHLVQGDVVGVPAEAKLKHGGPLTFRAIA